MFVKAILVSALFTIVYQSNLVVADCYIERGCSDPALKRQYSPGEWWIEENNCYSCECYAIRRNVLECKVESTLPRMNVRKSGLYARVAEDNLPEEIELPKLQAINKSCNPIRSSTFNWRTMTLEEVTYRKVLYYYLENEMQCCSSAMYYNNIPEECEVVKKSQCTTEIVLKDDPTKPCVLQELSMVG